MAETASLRTTAGGEISDAHSAALSLFSYSRDSRHGLTLALVRRMPPTDLLTRTFAFACQAVAMYRHLVRGGGAGRVLARQFLDAGTSLGANEEEAQAASSNADFISKQSIALREARESHYWLRLFEQTAIGSPQTVAPMRREAGELVAILSTVVKNARANAARNDR